MLESDKTRVWKLGTIPNEHVCRETQSIMEDSQAMDLETVSRSESLISRTDLDSHTSMVLAGRNTQIASDTSRSYLLHA